MKFLTTLVLICLTVLPAHAQQTGWIGVTVEDGKDQGAVLRSVETGSPAEKAGLKSGDVVVEYNKTPVLGGVQFGRLVRETPVGRTVEIKVRRDNRDQTLQVTAGTFRVGDRMTRVFPNANMRIDELRDRLGNLRVEVPRVRIATSYTRAGIRVDEMTAQLRDFFGVNGDAGVLVSSVESGSAADKAGLKAGDVISAIDSRSVRTPAEFEREMRTGSGKVSLKVVRDRRDQDISLDRSPDSRR